MMENRRYLEQIDKYYNHTLKRTVTYAMSHKIGHLLALYWSGMIKLEVWLQVGGTLEMNYTANWNILDSAIFFLEGKIGRVKAAVKDSKDENPDVEIMIQAETEHLKAENETLKKRETPAYLIEDAGQYLCPECRMEIVDTVKYCPNCGHRVMKAIGLKYSLKE